MISNRLDSLLARGATRDPERIAVIDPGRGEVSYGELQALAGQIQSELVAAGVGHNDRVGICAPKSIGTVASIFASLASGACHVPVDPGAPPQRSAYIFMDCTVKAVLIERGWLRESPRSSTATE